MQVQLAPTQEELVRVAVESGRLRDADDAAHEAFDLWEKRERKRLELVELLKEAEADFASGIFTTWTEETLPQLFEEIKREGRAIRKAKKLARPL